MTKNNSKGPVILLVILIGIIALITSPIWAPLLLLGLFLIVFFYLLAWLIPFFSVLFTGIMLVIGIYCIPAGVVAMYKVGFSFGISELGAGLILIGLSLIAAIISILIIILFLEALYYAYLGAKSCFEWLKHKMERKPANA